MRLRKHLRRVLVFIGVTALLLGIAVGLVVWRMGPGSIQDWIGSQLQAVAGAYLNPKLSFTNLAYEYPLGVSLKNLRLTADDPANPGRTVDIIACDSALLALGEIPRVGKPIIIEKISLRSPLIAAVAVEPGSKQFVGFSDLIKGGSTTVTEDKKPAGAPQKLSDIFRMRKVELIDGKIVYDARIAGTVPMTIDQINTSLNIEPTESSWYKLSTVISRKPVFDLAVAGQFDLDSFATRDLDLRLMTDLGQDKLRYLPPELQVVLKKYQAKGKLDVAVTGAMPIMDPTRGDLHATLKLDHANVASGGFHLPVENVDLDARFADGKATLPSLKIAALGGTADLSGAVLLNNRLDADLHVRVADMVLEKLLADPSKMSRAPASLNFDFNLAASLMSLLGKAPSPADGPLAAISLKNFRLTSIDPIHAGRTLDVVACKNLDVSMSQPVVTGKPIVVDKIIFDHPVVSAVAVAPGSIEYAGVPLLPATPATSGPPAEAPDTSVSGLPTLTAPGDLFRIKEFRLDGARVMYDPRITGSQPMVLDPISTSLYLDPSDPGAYTVDMHISRAPVFALGVNGQVNIDHPGLQKLKLNLQADLQQNQLDFLPPQLQLVLRQSSARGKLTVDADASLVLADPTHGNASFDLNVQNLQLQQGKLHVPVESLAVSARLGHGQLHETATLAMLKNVFEIDGSSTLNNRLDTDVILKLKEVNLERLLSTLNPDVPVPATSTTLNADIECRAPLMVAMSQFPSGGTDPVGVVSVHHFRLTTDNPMQLNQRLDFVSCDLLETALSSLPAPGQPLMVHHVSLTRPTIRAVAMSPESKDFAGFFQLKQLVASLASPTTAPTTTAPATQPTKRPSELLRLQSLTVADASLNYNPWIYGTIPMSLNGITAKVNLDSPADDAYRFTAVVPGDPDLHVDCGGRVNVDSLQVDPLKLAVAVKLGNANAAAFPPQLQEQLQPFAPEGTLNLDVAGTIPGHNPTAADLLINLKADDLKATANGYRIPVDHLRMPIHLKGKHATLLDPQTLGGPTLSTLGGVTNLTGVVTLDSCLTSTLTLKTDGILLQQLMATKIQKPAPDLVGAVHAKLDLQDAPLLVVAAHATPPPGPNDPAAPPSPLKAIGLPAIWGSAHLNMDHARLAGLEIIQGVSNIARTAFSDVFNRGDSEQRTVNPKETAEVAMVFERDNVRFTLLHYEGEVVGADGKGYVTLDQHVNLDLTGGPQAKLADIGVVGSWLKQASDSLLYYHVTGTVHDLHYEVRRGNGAPIVSGAKTVTQATGKVVGKSIDKTKAFIGGLFKH